ncbi:uncharacterized protein isoform X2 [Rhodnius prolixus]|uniref:uncharacterized protein isoform X2 n=1 Tax=Rhodnius prolixus TaxID=13249 RepID=UPI003D187A84
MPPQKKTAKGRTARKKKTAHDLLKMNELNPLRVEYENEPPSMTADRMLTNGDIVWARHYQGIKIQQLFSDFYNPVIDLLQQSTLRDDPLCRIFKMDKNWRAMEEMLFKARDWLSQSLSLVAVDEETDQVYGAVIGRIVNSDELLNEMEQLKEMEIKQQKEKEEQKLAAVSKKELRSISRKSIRNKKKSAKTKKGAKQPKEITKQNQEALRADLMRSSVRTKKVVIPTRTYPKLDPPVDVIPIEEKTVVQPCIFDDSYEGYSDEILTKFLHFRYCLFSVIDLFFEFRCYYKIYGWTVNQEHQNQDTRRYLDNEHSFWMHKAYNFIR